MKMEADMSAILEMLQEVKEQSVGRIYNTQELSEYLKVGKGAIEKLRQNGELGFAKIGRTIVYTQADVDRLIANNHVKYVS